MSAALFLLVVVTDIAPDACYSFVYVYNNVKYLFMFV